MCVILGRVDSEINVGQCKANLKAENNTLSLDVTDTWTLKDWGEGALIVVSQIQSSSFPLTFLGFFCFGD